MKYTGLEEKLNVGTELEGAPQRAPLEIGSPQEDHDFARETMHNLIQKGNEALEGILAVARHSEHPRSYEVAGQLIKTVSDAAKNLMELQKIKKDLETEKNPKNVTQNNLFVGSTHELMKMMKQLPGEEILATEAKIVE